MQQLGYETEVEIDISMKSQLIDIISVRRETLVEPKLPPIYWQVFGQLNEHNLFSDKIERILAAYTTIQSEPGLFADISIYWKQVLRKIDREITNMYTREDFLRDYPDTNAKPGLFEWLEELARKKHQQGIEQGIEQGEATARQMIEQILRQRLSDIPPIVHERLSHCTLAQLNTLVNPALDAATWDEFVTALPTQPQ